MYFIIRYNWNINTFALTNRKTVGYFDTLSKACDTVANCLPNDDARNSVAVVEIPEGIDQYAHPKVMFEWCEQYQCYVPIAADDPRHNFTMCFTSRD